MIQTILLVFAFVLFAIAAGAPAPQPYPWYGRLVASGLACWVLSVLLGGWHIIR